MYVMLTQKLSKGFESWKDMVHENKHKLEGFKGRVIFAGSHAEDDNSMVVITVSYTHLTLPTICSV